MTRIALLAVPLALGASAAQAAEVQIAATGPVVELTVTESVKARPDIATISAGVTVIAPTAAEAMQQNARQMSAVIDRLKALGIKGDDIRTTSISLYAQYDYDQEAQKQVFRGYQASNRVSVVLRKLDETGRTLDALVAAGATDLSGPEFSLEDNTGALSQARKAAMQKAGAQAKEYAALAGYSGMKLLEISEALQPGFPVPILMQSAKFEAAAPPTPVEPGLVGSSVTITVKYELTN